MNILLTSVSPTEIDLMWSPPLIPYGNIISYTVIVNGRMDRRNSTSLVINTNHETNITIASLRAFTWYNISIAGSTRIGKGPYGIVSLQTPQDSKL